MLKIIPPINLNTETKSKCGEIYYISSTNYTIDCCFCNMKLFVFEDFLLHLQNVHFKNESKKMDTSSDNFNAKVFTINEDSVDQEDYITEEVLDDNVEQELYTEEVWEESFQNFYEDLSHSQSTSETNESTDQKVKIEENPIEDENNSDDVTIENEFIEFLDLEEDDKTAQNCPKQPSTKKKQIAVEFACSECGEVFPQRNYLDQHVFDLHKGYKCSLCDKRFRLIHHLKRHIDTHNSERKYKCPIPECRRAFKQNENLKNHIDIHTTEKNFICDFENCGKAFQSQQRLTRHSYVHIPGRRTIVVCDVCGYSCNSYAILQIHLRRHTGEKPFICKVCDKGFPSKTGLNVHSVTHATTRPHVCQICKATFANYRILQRHAFIHSDEKKFKCKFCDSAFKQDHGLYGHIRRKHGDPKATTNSNVFS